MAKDHDAQDHDARGDDPYGDDELQPDEPTDEYEDDPQPDDELQPDEPTDEYDDDSPWDEEAAEPARTGVGRGALIGGSVAVAVVVVAAVALVWSLLGGDGDAGETSEARIAQANESPTGSGSASPSFDVAGEQATASAPPAERCARAAQALTDTLRSARPALGQWGVHVGAMNKLVVGEITLQQATAFWDRTRVGAQRSIREFRRSRNALGRAGVDCPRPGLVGSGGAALRPCAQHVNALVRVLRVARTSIDTWDTHVRHMDMLRMGTLSPERATEMWLSMWQEGVRDLDAYRAAARTAGGMQGCERG